MDRRTISKNGCQSSVDCAANGDRPLSRARRSASKGIRTPETAYRVLLDGVVDLLNGAMTPKELNSMSSAMVRTVVFAQNADSVASLGKRAELEDIRCRDEECCGELCDEVRDGDSRDAKIAALERELAEIKANLRRPMPKKG